MDKEHIQRLAESHRQELALAHMEASIRARPSRREIWDQQIGQLMADLDSETVAWCAIYNEAIGAEKLRCENHEVGINVEWVDHEGAGARIHIDPTHRQLSLCAIDVGHTHEHAPVAMRAESSALVLLLNGEPARPAEVIAYLLDRFTTQLTWAECAETGSRRAQA